MEGSRRPSRHALTVAEAQAIAEDLRHDRRDRIEDARFPEGFQLRVGSMSGVTVTNSQLWLTVGGGMFRGGLMEGCRFVDVELDPLTVYQAEMRSNTFERVTFGVREMGGLDDTVIEGGTFRDCRFRDYGFRRTTFDGVTIDGGRMDRVRLTACTFRGTRISSTLRDVTVADGRFEHADLSGSDVIDVAFDEWRSADLRLPVRRTGFFVTPAAARDVLATVLDDLTVPFRDRVYADLILAGYDLVAVSERFFMSALDAQPKEASVLVDALFPHRLDALDAVPSTASATPPTSRGRSQP